MYEHLRVWKHEMSLLFSILGFVSSLNFMLSWVWSIELGLKVPVNNISGMYKLLPEGEEKNGMD